MSMDEIAKILNQREATRKPDSVQSTLEATEKVELEVTEKYQIKNPELNDLIQFDRTDLPEDVGLFLQSKSPEFDEAEMLTELQGGILKLTMQYLGSWVQPTLEYIWVLLRLSKSGDLIWGMIHCQIYYFHRFIRPLENTKYQI